MEDEEKKRQEKPESIHIKLKAPWEVEAFWKYYEDSPYTSYKDAALAAVEFVMTVKGKIDVLEDKTSRIADHLKDMDQVHSSALADIRDAVKSLTGTPMQVSASYEPPQVPRGAGPGF